MTEIVKTRIVHAGWGRWMMVTLRLPDGTEVERQLEDHGAAVAVLPYDPQRRVALLVEQVRTGPLFVDPAGAVLLEAPAGLVDAGEDAATAARREAMEETGVRLGELEPLGGAYSAPGSTTERIWLFLAPFSAADRIEAGGGLASEHEDITVIEAPLDDLLAKALSGELADMKTLALVLALKAKRPDLFG